MRIGPLVYKFFSSPFGLFLLLTIYALLGAAVFSALEEEWSFETGLAFCGTVFTTIGYGHLTSQTVAGKVLTCLYSVIGIPLCFMTLVGFGDLLHRGVKYLLRLLRRLCRAGCRGGSARDVEATALPVVGDDSEVPQSEAEGRSSGPAVIDAESVDVKEAGHGRERQLETRNDPDCNVCLVFTVTLACLLVYVLIGAAAATAAEIWSFSDSVYFIVTSLFTIGFGDLLPEHPTHSIGALSAIYIFVGLILMSSNVHAGISVARVFKAKIKGCLM
ncbi:TWiK family of potassium channels protein 18-like [Lingula anatina]|uniref:TWiK family of potassium channels protein 18-like n=1 Tax=Lingula anatina TaxID=7574 RepID=A0A1S3JG20_LINAN|nr:TWiK family of potassium channels protein 18-like [Lingula anatina]|eukprot:XP_013409347.1 TWiK family of potassium channels protein 18-like [Lingula anatina]